MARWLAVSRVPTPKPPLAKTWTSGGLDWSPSCVRTAGGSKRTMSARHAGLRIVTAPPQLEPAAAADAPSNFNCTSYPPHHEWPPTLSATSIPVTLMSGINPTGILAEGSGSCRFMAGWGAILPWVWALGAGEMSKAPSRDSLQLMLKGGNLNSGHYSCFLAITWAAPEFPAPL